MKYIAFTCLFCKTPHKSMQTFFCVDCASNKDQVIKDKLIEGHKEKIDSRIYNTCKVEKWQDKESK